MRHRFPFGESRTEKPRIIYYHQTHYHDNAFVSILPILTKNTSVTHVYIAAIHIKSRTSISLNDDPYTAPRYLPLWDEVRKLQAAGIKVMGMLGGAAQGSFTVLDGGIELFEAHYTLLHQLLQWTGLDGLDLDVEEAMSLPCAIRLIDRLKEDFGRDFLITLAPVATAMLGQQNLSGFDYEALEKAFAHKIAWYNTQFYCGWGCMRSPDDYEKIIARGWPPNKIVAGLVTNPANCTGWVGDMELRATLTALLSKYPTFGGVMGWEYFNAMTEAEGEGKPWCWANFMGRILHYSSPDQ
jgi:hypothetical protein